MDKFWKASPWLTRLILFPPTVVFTLIAARYLAHPVAAPVNGEFASYAGGHT